ncbi:Glycerate 2-kinase [uncultured archaeon]|nr:Glycerate 2-kinase [uncultured archaeon]
MIIKNFKELATNREKKDALGILETGLNAALPGDTLRKIVKRDKLVIGKKTILLTKYAKIFVVGFGKAADSMAKTVCSLARINGGIIVIPCGTKSVLTNKRFKILHAGHPIPNKQSVCAGKQIIEFLKNRKSSDFVIFLISGGGSSLLSLPDGISLLDKKITTSLLLKSGANIHEINCVRKHLSKIKGGKLAENLSCDAVSLVMSDVVGDDLSDIASATVYFDDTTFKDADKILTKYNLKKHIPQSVLKRLDLGIHNKIPETPKSSKIRNYIIAANNDCLDAMIGRARQLGYAVSTMRSVSGNVKPVSKNLLKSFPMKKHSCLIFGGEPTVKIIGNGKGGRSQELVLYVFDKIQNNKKNVVIASCGTDGKDGNTNASGAIIETSKDRIDDMQNFLKNNNSYYFFKKHKGLIFTGPTHTNLMDIGVLLTR